MHLIHNNGILFSSNPPLEESLKLSLNFFNLPLTTVQIGWLAQAHKNLFISLYCVPEKKYHYI